MRTLLLLRGAIGSGKSTWIKENKLEAYTLEADKIRTQFSSPRINEDGELSIPQKYDKEVWEHLYFLLEERMKRGDFTVIDATHNNPTSVNRYLSLASEYKYSVYCIQIDKSLDECLKGNKSREKFKIVPEEHVKRTWEMVNSTQLSSKIKMINHLSEIDNYFIEDITGKYEEIKVIGDIHGCYSVLREAIPEIDPDTLYVFVGDYVDRGIENFEALRWIMEISTLPNVVQLEGNHEIHLWNFASGKPIKSLDFIKNTIPQLEEHIDENQMEDFKKSIRKWYRTLRQCYAFETYGVKYLVTHGGLTSVPKLTYIPTDQMIRGVGNYDSNIGDVYEENFYAGKCQNFIQVHGHRGVKSTSKSISLEGEVEFGGELKILEITPLSFEDGTSHTERLYTNSVFKNLEEEDQSNNRLPKWNTENSSVNRLLRSRFIQAKSVSDNLISINFKSTAFFKKQWNDLTIKARGLFVDKKTGEVKIRSYNKFFNYEEIPSITGKEILKKKLKFPVKTWLKENGFLGIISVVSGNLVCASKSTVDGPFAKMFQELFNQESNWLKDQIKQICEKYNCSLVFEVIHKDDPHIIEYRSQSLIFLDAIPNQLDLGDNNLNVEFSETVSEEVMKAIINPNSYNLMTTKYLEEICHSWEDIEEVMNSSDEEIEGYVFEDSNGFLFKYKGKFYSQWKHRRSLVGKYLKTENKELVKKYCKNDIDFQFIEFISKMKKEELEKLSIIQLREQFNDNHEIR